MAVLQSILSSCRQSKRPYYRDNLLAKKLLSDIFRIFQGGVLSFNRTVHWRVEHATPSLSYRAKGTRLHVSNTEAPNSSDLNPVDYSIWSAGLLQEKVYRSRTANVNQLKMWLNDERGRFDQSIGDVASRAPWSCRLSACVLGAGQPLKPNQKLSAILSSIHQKLLN